MSAFLSENGIESISIQKCKQMAVLKESFATYLFFLNGFDSYVITSKKLICCCILDGLFGICDNN